MRSYLLKNGTVVNEGLSKRQDVLIKNNRIDKIGQDISDSTAIIIDLTNKLILGFIVAQLGNGAKKLVN